MAEITIAWGPRGGSGGSWWAKLGHRVEVYRRAHRRRAARRRRAHAVLAETHDARMFDDIGIAPRHRRYDWVAEMARAMGGRL